MTIDKFLVRLRGIGHLTSEEVEGVRSLGWSVSGTKKGYDILHVDDRPDHAYAIESGWAARYSVRPDGSRRITGFMLPGDFCGIHAMTDEPMEHAIAALTNCEVARVQKSAIEAAAVSSPALGKALWRSKLVDEAILRTWLLNSQNAFQAVAHLVCELHARAEAIGAVYDGRFEFPLTQEHIGDALGITPVHINRMVKQLRESGLAEINHREVSITNLAALQYACGFSPRYLHLPISNI